MKLCEIKGDLVAHTLEKSKQQDVILVHCISEDCKMGAGIAKVVRDKFGQVEEKLKPQKQKVGGIAWLFRPNGQNNLAIANLVTKQLYYHKPTEVALKKCLQSLCDVCVKCELWTLCISPLGCALDGLSWNRVRGMIETIFTDPRFQIDMVYYRYNP